MSDNQKIESLYRFRHDVEDMFNTIIAISRYRFLSMYLKLKKSRLKISDEDEINFLSPLVKFEKQNLINNFLLVNLITTLETFLKDRLLEEINLHPEKVKDLIIDYKFDRKLEPQDIINGPSKLAHEILDSIIYHNLKKVNVLYKIIFGFDILKLLPDNNIWKLVKIRHELVHRSGRKEDKRIIINDLELINSLTIIFKWVENIEFYKKHKKQRIKYPSFFNRLTKEFDEMHKNSIYKEASRELFSQALNNINYDVE